jgi:hypothetical protein
MRKINWTDGIQIVATVGVLAGLILVAYEIRQNSNLAEADAVRALTVGWQQIQMTEYETDIASIFVKSTEDPENLTLAEIGKMSAWLSVIVNQFSLSFSMDERGLGYDYGDVPYGTEGELMANFEYYFNSRFARSWYLENKFWIEPQIAKIIDREMEARPVQSGASYAERIRSRL